MGHSIIRVTMDVYGHLMHDADNEVTEKLAALVLGGSKMVATGHAASQEDGKCLKEMEAGVGIEPASTALQFSPACKSQQRAAGGNNNISDLQRGQQSAIMWFVVGTVPNLSQRVCDDFYCVHCHVYARQYCN